MFGFFIGLLVGYVVGRTDLILKSTRPYCFGTRESSYAFKRCVLCTFESSCMNNGEKKK